VITLGRVWPRERDGYYSLPQAREKGELDSMVVEIDRDLVERLVLEMASHGAYGESGVWRTTYSPEWVTATDTYAEWCVDAGLEARRDAVGNVWGILRGTDETAGSIVSGSHIDTQTPGGRYDGALGAIGALIALRALREQFGQPRVTLEAVALCEEESSRFPSANFWGSRAITGKISQEDPASVLAFDGLPIGKAMKEVGLDPARISDAHRSDIVGFVELHIEQGPILEQQDVPVGIVTSVTGIRHWLVELIGEENHAGAFPMDLRKDSVQGFSEIAMSLADTAHRWGRPAVTTIGCVEVEPNLTAAVAGRVRFTVDARHPDPQMFNRLLESHERMMREVAARRGLGISIETRTHHEPCVSDASLVAALERTAADQDIPCLRMASGAAHDTQQMGLIAPVAMVFVRSKDGRSHTPEEFSSVDDMTKGIEVLAGALRKLAY